MKRKIAANMYLMAMGLIVAPVSAWADGTPLPLQMPPSLGNGTAKPLSVELEVKSNAYTLWGPTPALTPPVTPAPAENPTVMARGVQLNNPIVTPSPNPTPLLMGPTLRIQPGKQLTITLKNGLNYKPSAGDASHSMTNPHGFDVINLHTHGLHISPNSPSDNVLLSIFPSNTPSEVIAECAEELGAANCLTGKNTYSYPVPANHPSGTYWYHAHKHGAVAMHIADGFAGALIVEDPKRGLESLPAVKAAREQVLMLQQVTYGAGNGSGTGSPNDPYHINCMSVYGLSQGCSFDDVQVPPTATNSALSVNGQFQPSISMWTNEVQLWRVINGTIGKVVPMCLLPVDGTANTPPAAYVLATDGVPLQNPGADVNDLPVLLGAPVANPATGNDILNNELLFLAAGQRLDLMVQAPARPGNYALYAAGSNHQIGQLCQASNYKDQKPILTVAVNTPTTPAAYNTQIPSQGALNKLQSWQPITTAESPSLPTQGVTFGFTTNTYAPNDGGASVVNARVFNPVPMGHAKVHSQRDLALNRVDLWSVQSAADTHMFHIHTNAFQLVSRGSLNYPFPIWRDTLLVNCAGILGNISNNCTFPGGLTGAYPFPDPSKNQAGQYGEIVQFLQKPTTYTGYPVMHCHNLSHEDNGMMELIKISP